jgi:hypothetical protein
VPLWIEDTVDGTRIGQKGRSRDFALSATVLLGADPPTNPSAAGERSHARASDDKAETGTYRDHREDKR